MTVVRSTAVVFAWVFGGATAAYAQGTTALLCQGSGSVLESRVSNGMEYGDKTHSYNKSTNSSTTGRRPFSGAVNVEIAGNSVRMRLPHEIMPKLNSARDGWFTLDDVFVGEKEITGTLKLNTVNRAKVRIDRTTGQLTLVSGFEDFDGTCNKLDTNSGPKF
ncbi:hypothetical protein [Paraburkholderia hospita]|uniref:hypothetical protein n=1 Tax=Paraburkholderia hospita TaxID=169430 RepID=UPI000B3477F9|nr:hypothetical protein [Paraburkholderia hospita]OUL96497.1 hypothetical protein CA603_05125 [Paraburkholderia hospita]